MQVHVAMQNPEGVLENEVEKKFSSKNLRINVEDQLAIISLVII